MRRFAVAALVVLIGVLAVVPVAQADSPHFIYASATINNAGQLVCSFKLVGLGHGDPHPGRRPRASDARS